MLTKMVWKNERTYPYEQSEIVGLSLQEYLGVGGNTGTLINWYKYYNYTKRCSNSFHSLFRIVFTLDFSAADRC